MAQLTTGVDKLIELVREKKRISVPDAAKALGMPLDTIQSWVDFLVEEHLLGIEYKFTTPFIYVNSEERIEHTFQEKKEEKKFVLKDFRDAYFDHAREQGMPEEKLHSLWLEHLRYVLDHQRAHFTMECKRRGIEQPDDKYAEYLQGVLRGA